MRSANEIESALQRAVDRATEGDCPPRLGQALRHAVLAGGKRLRPRLLLEVAEACGAMDRRAALGAATALELLHAASLVHDDLPCFDDAATRRGAPTVQHRFGEAFAVLTGDALIAQAFATVATETAHDPARLARLVTLLAEAIGARGGLTAGQAWESEPWVDVPRYHRLKTGALFEAAVQAGALVGGGDPNAWVGVGEALGRAYQVADDLHDRMSLAGQSGKTAGRDEALGRPNLAQRDGLESAVAQAGALAHQAANRVPRVPGAEQVRGWLLETLSAWTPGLTVAAASPATEVAR